LAPRPSNPLDGALNLGFSASESFYGIELTILPILSSLSFFYGAAETCLSRPKSPPLGGARPSNPPDLLFSSFFLEAPPCSQLTAADMPGSFTFSLGGSLGYSLGSLDGAEDTFLLRPGAELTFFSRPGAELTFLLNPGAELTYFPRLSPPPGT
jgi:hypothetical protein